MRIYPVVLISFLACLPLAADTLYFTSDFGPVPTGTWFGVGGNSIGLNSAQVDYDGVMLNFDFYFDLSTNVFDPNCFPGAPSPNWGYELITQTIPSQCMGFYGWGVTNDLFAPISYFSFVWSDPLGEFVRATEDILGVLPRASGSWSINAPDPVPEPGSIWMLMAIVLLLATKYKSVVERARPHPTESRTRLLRQSGSKGSSRI